ncbi:MAG: glycosyltransferase family 2 protein [Solirubrobacteraceae bacterium]
MPEPQRTPPDALAYAAPGADEVFPRLAEIERQLRQTQALSARGYEQSFGWGRRLQEARGREEHRRAFEESEPLVSVVIATYNGAALLVERALASVRRQTHEHWEAIVVGDACTDDTEAAVAGLGDPRIRFHNRPVRGPYPEERRARWYVAGVPPANEALRRVTGSWFAPLDHDDEWSDDHLERLLAVARRERVEFVHGRAMVRDHSDGSTRVAGSHPPRHGDFFQGTSLQHAALAAFEWDMNCRFAGEPADWNRTRRLLDAGATVGFVDEVLMTYHHVPKHEAPSTEERVYAEMQTCIRTVEEGRDWWQARAEHFEREYGWWRERAEAYEREVEHWRATGAADGPAA